MVKKKEQEQEQGQEQEQDNPLADIYKRAAEKRASTRDETDAMLREQDPGYAILADQVSDQAADDSEDSEDSENSENSDDSDDSDDSEEAEPSEDSVTTETTVEKVDKSPERVTIKVYGQIEEVDRDDIIDAGREILGDDATESALMTEGRKEVQRRRAAKVREEVAATKQARQELDQREAHIRLVESNLRKGLDENGRPLRATSETKPPATGASAEEQRAKAEKLVNALYDGDRDGATQNLAELLTAAQGASATQNALSDELVSALSDQVIAKSEQRNLAKDRQEANRLFKSEFSAIAGDEAAFSYCQAKAQGIMKQNPGMSAVDVAREAGQATMKALGLGKTKPADKEATDEIEKRRVMKRQITSSSATSRAVTPSSEPKTLTNKQYVEQMQRDRNQVI